MRARSTSTPTLLTSLALAAMLGAALACAKPQPPASEPAASDTASDTASDPAADAGQDGPPPSCGGLAGTACPDGLTCVDDPADDCDPASGGADCLGTCVTAPSECQAAPDSGKRYVGHSPDMCARMRFACEDGEQYFADDCGCGCELSPS